MIINKVDNPYIVFDLDDTLFQEVDYLKSAYKEIAKLVSPVDPEPVYSEMFERYKAGENVLVNQVGCYGINLGRIDFYFDKNKAHTNQGRSIIV